jgi:hypothetical protein
MHGNLVQALEGTSFSGTTVAQILTSPAMRTQALDRILDDEKFWFPSLSGPHTRPTVLSRLFNRNIETYVEIIRHEAPSAQVETEVRQFREAITQELDRLPPSAPGIRFYVLEGYWDISVNALAALAVDESTGQSTLVIWGDWDG